LLLWWLVDLHGTGFEWLAESDRQTAKRIVIGICADNLPVDDRIVYVESSLINAGVRYPHVQVASGMWGLVVVDQQGGAVS